MAATQILNGKQQFTDINGAPLVGGTVGMYAPGTLIAMSTWQDAAQTILNTNPIILDSRGQCVIYGSGSYRQILKDALGNIIWDVLAFASGGIVLPVATPEQFGAKGDNTTDDYAAFNSALSYLSSTGGGTLVLSAKTYLIGTQLVLSTPVQIAGQGKGSTTININSSGQTSILISCNNNRLTGFTVADGKGKGGNSVGIKLGGVNPTGTNYIVCFNVLQDIGYNGLKYGRILQITGSDGECYENTFSSEVFNNVGLAIYHANPSTPGNGGCNANYTENFTVFNTGPLSNGGIYIQAGSGNVFKGAYIEGMTNAGPLTNPTAIQIDHASSDGFNNDGNIFIGVNGESNTYSIVNANALTEFYGSQPGTGTQTWTQPPAVFIMGAPSNLPVIIPGYLYQANNQIAGYSSLVNYLTGANGANVINGPLVAKTYIATQVGSQANVANNGTFTIAIPSIGKVYALFITTNANDTQVGMWLFGTDGSTNQGTITPVKTGPATISINASTITVTNTSGSTATVSWGFTQMTP